MYGHDDGGFARREMQDDRPAERRERYYQRHVHNEDSRGFHVDGCFYCGGAHPSDCCPDSSAKDEYWEPGTPDMEIER